MTDQGPPNWFPDPFGRFEIRFWDGTQWTEHVGSQGRQLFDPFPGSTPALAPVPAPVPQPAPQVAGGSKKVQREVRSVGIDADAAVGGGTLFTESVLVVSQKAKLIEVNAEYAVYDQHGRQIGSVREVGQSLMKKALRGGYESNRAMRLQVLDSERRVLMTISRPSVVVKAKVMLRDPEGVEIGQITQKTLGIIGGVRFALESAGEVVGSITAEDWYAWNFSILDAAGNEIARITKTWVGLSSHIFSKRDNYVVEIFRPLEDPLRRIVTAAAIAVDTVLHQPNRARI